MTNQCAFLFKVLAIGWVFGHTGLTWASREITVPSIYDGTHPYLVVYEDSEGNSQKKPGIYISNEKGHWRPLIEGSILSGSGQHGIVAQLALTQQDRRYASLAVVGQKLRLIQMNPAYAGEQKVLTFGVGEGEGEIQDMNGLPVSLGPIEQVQDIVVRTGTPTKEGQQVLVSVRSSGQQYLGDGITFGFFVLKGSPEYPDRIQLENPPVVLDYQFLNFAQLGTLLKFGQKSVLSRLVLSSVLKRTAKEEAPILVQWRNKVKSVFEKLSEKVIDLDGDNAIPLVDLGNSQPWIVNPPGLMLYVGNTSLRQMFDVFSGKDEIVIGGDRKIRGRIDHKKGLDYSNSYSPTPLHTYTSPKSEALSVVYINSQLHFLTLNGSQPVLLPLDQTGPLPDNVTFTGKKILRDDGLFDYYLLHSTQTGTEGKTVAYVLSRQKSGVLMLGSKLELMSEFISDQYELADRFDFLEIEQDYKEVYFDNRTPIRNSLAGYRQSLRQTIPFVNLTRSTEGHFVYSYLEPLEERALSNGLAVYRRYDRGGVDEDQSALTFMDSRKQIIAQFRGDLLTLPTQVNQDKLEILSREFNLNSGTTPVRLALIPMDGAFQKGAKSFKLIAILSGRGITLNQVQPVIAEFNFGFPFEELANCQLIHYAGKKDDQFNLIVAQKNPGSPELKQGTLHSRLWKVESKKENDILYPRTSFLKEGWKSPNQIDLTALAYQIKMDIDGNVYWLATPDRNPVDPQFQLIHLMTGQTVLPNGMKPGSLKLYTQAEMETHLSEESFAKEASIGFFKNISSKWKIYGQEDVKRLLGLGPDTLENLGENLKSFPGLEDTLEQVADLESEPVHEVFLVSEDMVNSFWNSVIYVLGHQKGRKNSFHLDNKRVSFSTVDTSSRQQSDYIEALEAIRTPLLGEKKSILLVQGSTLLEEGTPRGELDEGDILLENPEDHSKFYPHLLYLLAGEGKNIPLKDFQESKLPAPRISTVIVCTPRQWATLKNSRIGVLNKFKVMDSFKMNRTFLVGNWKVWPPKSDLGTKEMKAYAEQGFSEVDKEVFPNLNSTLIDIARLDRPAEHKILLVSSELRNLVKKMIFSRWATENRNDPWNYKNPELDLYKLPETVRPPIQENVFQNFDAMKGDPKRRAVFVAEIRDLIQATRPEPNFDPFLISDWIRPGSAASGGLKGAKSLNEGGFLPHLFYLLATEGARVSAEEWVNAPHSPEVSILLLGEPQEWEILKKDISWESRFGILQDFETFHLERPSFDTRKELLSQIFNHSDVQTLGYTFEAKEMGSKLQNLSSDEAQDKLLGYLVNRTESLSKEFQQEPTSAFIKVLSAFRAAVAEDPELRTSKILNRSYLERLLSRIFSIPLNLNILPPTDPYVLLSHERAALRLQEAGYRGPIELKNQVIRTLLAPTRNDSSMSVPGSIILLGRTSTGKTMLFKTFMKILDLKEYQYSHPNDEEAGYMIVNVGRLTSDKVASADLMTVADAIKHISNFLSLPRGYRGFILFDDLHKGDKEVTKILIKFLQSLFDAEKGVFKVERFGGKTFEIPVRNIHPWITLNPTQDQEKLKRYASVREDESSDVDVVVATLSSNDNPIERSFVTRWGLVMNLNKFPSDAKGPALAAELRSNSKNDLNFQGRFVIVSPDMVDKVVSQFPNANAREFLSSATSQILQAPRESGEKGSLFVVVPSKQSRKGGQSDSRLDSQWEATGRENGKIEDFVRKTALAIPVDQNLKGKLQLLSIMVDTFRTTVYESFIDSISQDERFAGTTLHLKNVLVPVLHGVMSNLESRPYLPVRVMNLDSRDFIDSREQLTEFQKTVNQSGLSRETFFDLQLPDGIDYSAKLKAYFDYTISNHQDRNRGQVVTKYTKATQQVLIQMLEVLLRVSSLRALPSPEEWLTSLKEGDPQGDLNRLATQLGDLSLDFLSEVYDPDLKENRNSDQFYPLSTFDTARLFSMILDRAVAELPWGKVTRFMLKNLAHATSDVELGQRSGVQDYLFTSKFSLLMPMTHELIFQMAKSSSAYKEWTPEFRKTLESEFEENCLKAFEFSNGGNQQ